VNRYYLQVYGCQMNQYDAGLVRALLDDAGYIETEVEDEADCCLVLTCAVRSHAENRALGRLGSLRAGARRKPGRVVAMLGCLSEPVRATLVEAHTADVILGPDEYRQLPAALAAARGASQESVATGSRNDRESYTGIRARFTGGVRGSVTVMRGCDNWCSYCIVPLTRGRERSRPPADIIDEARALTDNGVLDLTLLGQNVLAYRYEGTDFAGLLEGVAGIPGLKRLRFLTSHPKDLDERIIRTMADIPLVCPDLHLPFQSGSDRVLELMNRRYTRAEYLARVETARSLVPDLGLTTDVLVGFPGENDEDFLATLDLVRQLRFDAAYMFRYSVRPGTAAEKLGPKVSEAEAGTRLSRLIELQNRITRERNLELIGREFELLIEAPAPRGQAMLGRTRNNHTVVVDEETPVGTFANVRVTSLRGWTPVGQVLCETRGAPGESRSPCSCQPGPALGVNDVSCDPANRQGSCSCESCSCPSAIGSFKMEE